jgi:lysophospholipase L1-like esterase
LPACLLPGIISGEVAVEILFLGHSLVEYFDWQGRFPGHRVHNLGVAGETTGGLLARTGRIVSGYPDADAVLVMTGTNDLLMGDRTFLNVYRLLAEKLRDSYPGIRIVLHGILPAHPEWIDLETVKGVNGKIRKIARDTGTEFFDLTDRFTGEKGEVRLELLLEDGVHLSAEGYRVWSDALEQLLDDQP